MPTTADLHIVETRPLLAPATLLDEFPLPEAGGELVARMMYVKGVPT